MKKLTHFAEALANNTLSECSMILVKGGIRALISNAATPQAIGAAVSDEKRRQRPGGGVNTN